MAHLTPDHEPDCAWTEMPPELRQVLISVPGVIGPGLWAPHLSSNGVQTKEELVEILEAALAMARRLKRYGPRSERKEGK